MKTTLDLPADLVRTMKIQAAEEGRKLKEVAAEVFRRGLARPAPAAGKSARHRVKLPLVAAPKGAPRFDLSGERIHELELKAELERHAASLRR